jgi:hypothetical protein
MLRFVLPLIMLFVYPVMRIYADGGAQGVFLFLGAVGCVALAVLCIVGRKLFPANLQASRRARVILPAAIAGGLALSVPLSGLLFARSILFPPFSDSLVNWPRVAFIVSVPLFVATAMRFIVKSAAPGHDAMFRRAFIILLLLSLPIFTAGFEHLAVRKANQLCEDGLKSALGIGVAQDRTKAKELFAAAREHSDPPCVYGEMTKTDLDFAAKNIRRGKLSPDPRLNRIVLMKSSP